MTYRKFWYYWHTRNDSDSRNGWNASHSGHSGSWDRLRPVAPWPPPLGCVAFCTGNCTLYPATVGS